MSSILTDTRKQKELHVVKDGENIHDAVIQGLLNMMFRHRNKTRFRVTQVWTCTRKGSTKRSLIYL